MDLLPPMIKPIETNYAGCRFRSRLEARWAVFFDHVGISWLYEPEGFDCNGRWYLPDFYLPESQTWVEVKPRAEMLDDQTLFTICDWGMYLPGMCESRGTTRGLLLLGEIPRPPDRSHNYKTNHEVIGHPILQHHKGSSVSWCTILPRAKETLTTLTELGSGHYDRDGLLEAAPELHTNQSVAFWMWGHCDIRSGVELWMLTQHQDECYTAARSARFERGESG